MLNFVTHRIKFYLKFRYLAALNLRQNSAVAYAAIFYEKFAGILIPLIASARLAAIIFYKPLYAREPLF